MELKSLKAIAKQQMSRFERMGSGTTISQLSRDLQGDENVELLFAGQVNHQQAVLALTDRALIVTYGLTDRSRSVRFPYSAVDRVQPGLARVTISGSDLPEIEVHGIGRLAEFIAALDARRSSAESSSEGTGPVELLEQLHRLHESGLLTDVEYEAKKTELLERM